jgi:hypothetical protein
MAVTAFIDATVAEDWLWGDPSNDGWSSMSPMSGQRVGNQLRTRSG